MSKHPRKIIVGLGATLTLCIALVSAIVAYPLFYVGRIYPGVFVQDVEWRGLTQGSGDPPRAGTGVELGGLTVEEATALLTESLSRPSTESIDLQGSTRSWQLDWADAGREIDWAQTAEAAYQVARRGSWRERTLSAWRIRLHGLAVEPRLHPADEGRVKAYVDTIAHQVYVPPTDATLHIRPDGVTCVPGTTGRALDVETTTERVMAALNDSKARVKIATVDLPPGIREPEPGCTEARSLLAQPFKLIANDPLTTYRADFDAPPEQVATWLRVMTAGDQILLEVDETSIEAWLLEIAPQFGAERILDVDETLERTSAALRDGEHEAQSAIWHPQSSYVVQPGDTLFSIAQRFNTTVETLAALNGIAPPYTIEVGQALIVTP